jgi:hypothetical protein
MQCGGNKLVNEKGNKLYNKSSFCLEVELVLSFFDDPAT